MSRPLRLHVPGVPYHVISRGNAKQCIFEDDADHERFLRLLGRAVERFSIKCVAYCLLWNHYHLLLVPGEHSISRLMQHVNSDYCRGFNRKHGRIGHVLGGRFRARIIDQDSYLLTALRYIALNPVASGHVKRPEEWRWSSYRAARGLEKCPAYLSLDTLWRAFGATDAATGQARLTAFVSAATVGEGLVELNNTLLFGGEQLARKVDPLLDNHRNTPDFTYMERFATRPPLTAIARPAVDRPELEDAAWLAFRQHAYTLREIGTALGRPMGTIWSWIKRADQRKGERPSGAISRPAERPSVTTSGVWTPRTPQGQISIFE